jgi:hypothetical protein
MTLRAYFSDAYVPDGAVAAAADAITAGRPAGF